MHFKRLELVGFKSFAEKTSIQFEPGVTAIVGPNGCGKSNVSDAIRWVLGEQSAKSLRGSSMEDIIFNGAADKEPLNFAEVSITLSNETKFLDVDYDEVTVARRLYRSGESEYLLNKNTVRLKDIQELLLGTGIGTESYSVIEQGKMDRVLNSKPDERRAIFEEAAGITKFKSKKKEALRKLEQTDQNLLRVNDIVQEVKRQIASVERQAKKAEQYKIEFEKMKKLELSLASREFLIFQQDQRSKEDELANLKMEEAQCHEIVAAIESRYQAKKSELDALENTLNKMNSKEAMTQSEIRRIQDRTLLNRERVGELIERRGHIIKEIEAIQSRLTNLRQEFETLEKNYLAAIEEEKQGRGVLVQVENEFNQVDEACQRVFSQENAIRRRILECQNRRNQHQSRAAKCSAEIGSIGRNIQKIRQDQELIRKEMQEIEAKMDPAFLNSGQTPLTRLELKVKEWREKLMSVIRSWISRESREVNDEDEREFEKQIRLFAEEVGRIQGTEDHQEIESRHLRDAKIKLESRLSSLEEDVRILEEEEKLLQESQKGFNFNFSSIDEDEKRFSVDLEQALALTQVEQKRKEDLLVRLTESRARQANYVERRQQAEKDKNWILDTEKGQTSLSESLAREAEESVSKKQTLEAENEAFEKDLIRLNLERDEVLLSLETLRLQRQALVDELNSFESERQEKRGFLDQAREKVYAFQMQSAEIRFAMDRLKEKIYNAYQIDLILELERQSAQEEAVDEVAVQEPFDIEFVKTEVGRLKEKLNKMGPVNLVAIEEHQEMTERYNFLVQQEQDLIKAKDDLHKAILKINRTTKELFTETFAKIQGYFSEYYKLLFGGGSAELVLLDENDVLESGIDIVARPPGKKLQNITLLSGGEKALTAVALVFALFKVRPSPFCILDEIDAPLDESNVDRFCGVLKEFISESQFILITHNKRTMNLADAIYGITMAQTGVSRVVSVKFSNSKEKKEVREEAQTV